MRRVRGAMVVHGPYRPAGVLMTTRRAVVVGHVAAYTRGNGFEDGEPSPQLESVIEDTVQRWAETGMMVFSLRGFAIMNENRTRAC